MDEHPFKDAKDLQSLAGMLAPQYSQSQIREYYLNGLLPDFIGTDMDYWMLIRRYYALKEQYHYGDKPEDAGSRSFTPRGEFDYVDGSWPDAKKSSGENGD